MGETAENIADDLGITREEQDTFALENRRRAPGERRPYDGPAALGVGVGMGAAAVVEWLD